ncbi:MAG: tetratricopeptide repeat protein, partial [bacterium]|nr:tetratricopeptide repeat protein [bacterium]
MTFLLPLFLVICIGIIVYVSMGYKGIIVGHIIAGDDYIAPRTDFCRALRKIKPMSNKDDMESNIRYIEDLIAKYGTRDPWASKAFYWLGYYHFHLGQIGEALQNLNKCLALDEPYVGVHFTAQNTRIQSLHRLGRLDEAIAASKDLERLSSSSPLIHDKYLSNNFMIRAEMQAQLKVGGHAAAVDTYKEFLCLADNKRSKYWKDWMPYAYRALANQLHKMGETKQAISVYNTFLSRYPKDSASALVAMERLRLIRCGKEACMLLPDDLAECLSLYPANTGAGQHVVYELAMAYVRCGKPDEAAEVLKSMVSFRPKASDHEYSITLAAKAGMDLAGILKG